MGNSISRDIKIKVDVPSENADGHQNVGGERRNGLNTTDYIQVV